MYELRRRSFRRIGNSLLLTFFFVFQSAFHPSRGERTFKIGYISGNRSPKTGKANFLLPGLRVSGALGLAIDDVNQEKYLPEGNNLSVIVAETFGMEDESIRWTAKLWRMGIDVIIGPQESCIHEARLASSFNIPMISHFCPHHLTSDKSYYPTFARTRPAASFVSKSAVSLLLKMNWRKVAFFHSSSNGSEYEDVAQSIIETFKSNNIEIYSRKSWKSMFYAGWKEKNFFSDWVESTYENVRIYLILGESDNHIGLMEALHAKGLLSTGEYFVIGIRAETWDRKGIQVLFGYPHVTSSRESRILLQEVYGKSEKSYASARKNPELNIGTPFHGLLSNMSVKLLELRPESAYLYDAVRLYARSLKSILEEKLDPRNGTLIVDRIRGRSYDSAMGYMAYIDENGDAEGNYTLIARKNESGLFPVGEFILNEGRLPDLYLLSSIDWPNGSPPRDRPLCGFQNELCLEQYGVFEIAMGVFGGIFIVLSVVILVAYRNYRYEQELDLLLWKIDPKELEVDLFTPSSKLCRQPSTQAAQRTSQASLTSNPEADFRFSSIHTVIGFYKGRRYAVKKAPKMAVDITRKLKKELKILKDLRHENLNAFIGACVEIDSICTISEYCTRGSLVDILNNQDVKLDNMFLASLIGDLIRAMIYLHDTPIRFHGNLKSSNCLVDSRWVLKVSDFGLQGLKSTHYNLESILIDSTGSPADEGLRCQLVYKSPEFLRHIAGLSGGNYCRSMENDIPFMQRSDFYSFAMVLYELECQNGGDGPFSGCRNDDEKETFLTTSEVLRKIIIGRDFRPPLELLDEDNCFSFVSNVIQDAWQENPELRPDFKEIRIRLHPLRKGMKDNIFDNMLAMMEKYATNLEVLVDERTQLLVEEKRKTDLLLYEMLPKLVAENLKQGKKVDAESFDCVTVYFSDIVGFTAMCVGSSPLEVVDFLNDLYTCFDSIIENFDVYKVETIGDAYMVVSGLPERNGYEHAGQIASMALKLLESVKSFRIRHRQNETLMLRSGIHSGPVCAGVVGRKMPRYCLFGDTVNTTSRMESTGLPLKIHCSSSCHEILNRLGGYIMEERGFIEMKGKGEQKTYWLIKEIDENRRGSGRNSCPYRRGSARNHNEYGGSRLTIGSHIVNLSSSPNDYRSVRFDDVQYNGGATPMTPRSENEFYLPVPGYQLEVKRNSCPCIEDVFYKSGRSPTLSIKSQNHPKTEKKSFLKSPLNYRRTIASIGNSSKSNSRSKNGKSLSKFLHRRQAQDNEESKMAYKKVDNSDDSNTIPLLDNKHV